MDEKKFRLFPHETKAWLQTQKLQPPCKAF